MAVTASTRPQVWSFTSAVRHYFQHNLARSSRSHHSTSSRGDTRPYSTRLYHQQPYPHDPSMFESLESTKSIATSTTLSAPVSDSLGERPPSSIATDTREQRKRAHSHQTDPCFIAASQQAPLSTTRTTLPTLSPVPSSELEYPPPSVAPTEKENTEVSEQHKAESTPYSHGSEREKVQSSWPRRLWLHWFTAYRILIALTVVINAVVLALLLGLNLPHGGVLTATATNLLVSVLVRQEDLINLSFGLVAKIPSTLPLGLRKIIADFHHYGGIHIGCAVSALTWYMVFVFVNTQQCTGSFRDGTMTAYHWTDIITCYAFLVFVLFICLTAIPRLREKFHNSFEHTHRFAGWASLFVLWINAGIHTKTSSTSAPLERNPALWLLAAITFLIILPWLRIRRMPIRAQAISSREVKLTFPYADMPYTSTSRFSISPLKEWHAFATIPSSNHFTADIIISAAGDWTKSIVSNPPQRLWIRKPAAANFLAFTPIFNSVLLVATGAGIGPMLSLLSSPAILRMKSAGKKIRVMWCVYEPDAPHWAFVQSVIRNVDPSPKIFDSKKGRPDVVFEARYLAHINDVEAVLVVSNKKVTNDVVREVKTHGGAAYGAVFDS